MKVPILDLRAQFKEIRDDVLAAVTEVLESQVCIGGPKVAALEQEVAALCGSRYAVGVSSGTDALLCTLMAMDIGAGDEVITTPFTFFATAGSIARTGAVPVFVDIDPATFNIDPNLIEAAVSARTRAIMPVHLFGQVCDMDPILAVAEKHGLPVIEDAAQAIGATYKGRKAGSFGLAGSFSFFPSKNLGAAGDAGMIVTSDEALYRRLTILRDHGATSKYINKYIGGNFRLDAIQAAILLVKLPYLNAWSDGRRRNAERYDELFSQTAVVTPTILSDCVSIFNQYVVQVENRDSVLTAVRRAGIAADIYYPVPLHRQECLSPLLPAGLRLPVAERAAARVLALPVYPELGTEAIDYVAEAVITACAEANPAYA